MMIFTLDDTLTPCCSQCNLHFFIGFPNHITYDYYPPLGEILKYTFPSPMENLDVHFTEYLDA